MNHRRADDPKRKALQDHRTFHARAQQVSDGIFLDSEFFDPRDLLQVKYEMLRRVRIDGLPIAQVARRFALSRPAFYKAQKAFTSDGMWGLLPHKRGPRHAHKLSKKVMAFIVAEREQTPSLKTHELVRLIQDEFNLRVHPRTIERALIRAEKKTP
jgi:transposase